MTLNSARIAFALWLAAGAWAQTNVGRISGTVLDPSGAAVPGASVLVMNQDTELSWKASSDARGFYVVTNLPPGTYSVTVEAPGFKKFVRSGNVLVADGRITVDATLQVGDAVETVQVTEVVGETVNTVSGEISRVVDSEQVQDLALNGRNYMQLVTLIPGAALLNDDQLALTTSLSTTGQAINGNRPNTSNVTVDGSFNLDAGSNGSQINNIGVDFIREVQVQTSSFSAEYGRQSGASVNVVTRSGGNQFHGGLFEFVRNEKLDARSFFSPERPSLRFNNFGWSLGGPLIRSKLFFFGGQEWKLIRRYTDVARRTLPTRAERAGDFSVRPGGSLNYPGTSQPIPNRNAAPLITPDGKAIAQVYERMERYAVSYMDTPTGNNAIYQMPNPFDARQDLLRLDYKFNDRHNLFWRYTHDDYDVKDPFGTFVVSQLPTVPGNRVRPAYSLQLTHTWVATPRLVNEAKGNAGWHSQRVFLIGQDWKREPYGFQFPQLFAGGGYYPDGIPDVSVSGFSSFRGPTYYVSTSTDISFRDVLTYIRGAHTLKAGFQATRNRKDANGRPPLTGNVTFNPSGNTRTTGNAFADALLGNFRTYVETEYDPLGMFRFSQYDAFVTDQWRIARQFSVEIGMRFQAILPAYAVGNNLANFVPALYDPAKEVTLTNSGLIVPGFGFIYNGLIRAGDGVPKDQLGRIPDGNSPKVLSVPAGAPRGLYKSSYPLAPRFSFAWAPFKNSRTAVRGGFGLFYDRNDLTGIVQGGLPMPPFAESLQYENGNIINPTGGSPTARGAFDTIRPMDPEMKAPYSMNYSLSIQRQLPAGLFLETAYIGNQGRHFMRQPDINQPAFSVLRQNQDLPAAQRKVTNALRPYKGYSQILMRLADANSNYNALQVYLTRRKGRVTMTAAYTWAKTLTDASSNSEASEEPFSRRFNYGPASFDRRHVFVSTFNLKAPTPFKSFALSRAVLGGWELSGIARAQTGPYSSVSANTDIGTRRADYIGGDVKLPAGERTVNRYFNTAAFAAPPPSRRGNTGAGIIEGPGLQLFDFSIRKQFRIREGKTLRFQGDMFNAFNGANLRGLSTNVSSRDFGALTASGPGRNVQLGLRINF